MALEIHMPDAQDGLPVLLSNHEKADDAAAALEIPRVVPPGPCDGADAKSWTGNKMSGQGLSVDGATDQERTLTTVISRDRSSDPIYVEFSQGDPRNPIDFSRTRKWVITIVASVFAFLVSSNGATYALGIPSMQRDLNCTSFQATIGIGIYGLGFGLVPLVTASFSEEFGRHPVYIVSAIGFAAMNLQSALSHNIQTVIVARFISGAFGSTGSTMVGGTIADIWNTEERGLPMSIFSLVVLGAAGTAPVAAGWIEQNPHLQWRWIQWISFILDIVCAMSIPIFMSETRSSVILTRIAKKMRKDTGEQRYRARAEVEGPSLRTLLYISATRPLHLLMTEPTVASFSLWIAFAWGVYFSLLTSIGPIFTNLHSFNSGQSGMMFLTLFVGTVIGYINSIYQAKLYRKNVARRGPEARLYLACFAAILFPIGMFILAWTAYESVPWIAPSIGIVIFQWGVFAVYSSSFLYLADVYGPFASSAIAGLSLSRNLMGMIFPLFTEQMFKRLGYNWGNSLFAFVAVALLPIPYVLFLFGPSIRARSKFASQVFQTLDDSSHPNPTSSTEK